MLDETAVNLRSTLGWKTIVLLANTLSCGTSYDTFYVLSMHERRCVFTGDEHTLVDLLSVLPCIRFTCLSFFTTAVVNLAAHDVATYHDSHSPSCKRKAIEFMDEVRLTYHRLNRDYFSCERTLRTSPIATAARPPASLISFATASSFSSPLASSTTCGCPLH